MQIDANFVNDFFDYTRGNDDTATRLGPLRACTQGWVKIDSMKRAIALTTCIACIIGLPLIWFGGLEMIAIGIACVVFCILYTTHLSYIGMGDVLVLAFFSLVPSACFRSVSRRLSSMSRSRSLRAAIRSASSLSSCFLKILVMT